MVSTSAELNDAPSSSIWRTVMRQPSFVCLRATIRSTVWQVVQALATTSLPGPSGRSAANTGSVISSASANADGLPISLQNTALWRWLHLYEQHAHRFGDLIMPISATDLKTLSAELKAFAVENNQVDCSLIWIGMRHCL